MHAATSKPAQRAYLGTLLFFLASTALLVASTLAFLLFYHRYVPHVGLEAPVHLQFDARHPPQGTTARLRPPLTADQAYDVALRLQLPRTPANRAVGNFMLDLALLAPSHPAASPADLLPSALHAANASGAVLARARRPAILTYASPLVDAARTLAALPWFLLGWRRESETLTVPMLEAVAFARGADGVPDRARVVVEAATAGAEQMQFYDVAVRVRARFRGLRWLLYNYAVTSFVVFTAAFYGVALTTAFCAYVAVSMYAGSEDEDGGARVKREPGAKEEDPAAGKEAEEGRSLNPLLTSDLSDTARDFPTRGRQMPLRFPQREADDSVVVKNEEEEEALGIPPLGGEADDEDEAGASSSWRDSGIGTGRDNAERRRLQRRKRSESGD